MDIGKEVEKINKEEIIKIFKKYNGACNCTLKNKGKYIFTMKKYSAYLRLYIDKNIQVFIRTNTINSDEKRFYNFVDYLRLDIQDLNLYRKVIRDFYINITKEIEYTYYTPETHNEMIPTNATQEEKDRGWYLIYENRLLTELSYEDLDGFYKWIEKVSDKKYKYEQM